MSKKPYWDVPILETNEALVPLALDLFHLADPHPYQALAVFSLLPAPGGS
jgi:hypothetical protein